MIYSDLAYGMYSNVEKGMQVKKDLGRYVTMIAICVVPLIVAPHYESGDLFSYWKATFCISIAGVGLLFLHEMGGLVMAILLIFALLLDPFAQPYLFETWATYVSYCIIFLLSLRYARRWVMPFLALSAFIVASVGISQWLGYRPIVSLISGKVIYKSITSTLHNENYIGTYCAMIIPLLFVYGSEKNRWYLIPTAVLAVLLIVSESWLGVLGVAASCILFLCLPQVGRRAKLCAFVAVIAASCLFTVFKGPTRAADTLRRTAQKASLNVDHFDKLFGRRGYIWAGAIKVTKPWPSGPGRLAYEFPHDPIKEHNLGMRPPTVIDRPHNVYLQVAYSFGLVGLLSWLTLTAGLARSCLRSSIYDPERAFCIGCWLGVFGFLVAGLLNDGGPSVWPVYAVLFGGAVSCGYPPEH